MCSKIINETIFNAEKHMDIVILYAVKCIILV